MCERERLEYLWFSVFVCVFVCLEYLWFSVFLRGQVVVRVSAYVTLCLKCTLRRCPYGERLGRNKNPPPSIEKNVQGFQKAPTKKKKKCVSRMIARVFSHVCDFVGFKYLILPRSVHWSPHPLTYSFSKAMVPSLVLFFLLHPRPAFPVTSKLRVTILQVIL